MSALLRTAAFIDGANLHATARTMGYTVDFKKLRAWLGTEYDLIRPYYYSGVKDTMEDNNIIKLLDWLEYNGFHMNTKIAREYAKPEGGTRIKADLDVNIAIDMVKIASKVEHMIIFSGDGDLAYAVEYVQEMCVRVTVVSTINTTPAMINDDLRRQADNFIDLESLKDTCLKLWEHRETGRAPRFGT